MIVLSPGSLVLRCAGIVRGIVFCFGIGFGADFRTGACVVFGLGGGVGVHTGCGAVLFCKTRLYRRYRNRRILLITIPTLKYCTTARFQLKQ